MFSIQQRAVEIGEDQRGAHRSACLRPAAPANPVRPEINPDAAPHGVWVVGESGGQLGVDEVTGLD